MYNSGYSLRLKGWGIAKVNLPIMSPVVTICTASLTFNNFTFCPHSVFMFCVDLRTNSDYFPIQH